VCDVRYEYKNKGHSFIVYGLEKSFFVPFFFALTPLQARVVRRIPRGLLLWLHHCVIYLCCMSFHVLGTEQ